MDVLSEDEFLILSIIKEYLIKNREFNNNKIISFINYRLRLAKTNINSEGVRRIIKSLIDKNLIVEGSKLTRDKILLNNKRFTIFKYISENPGTYYNKIVKELNYSNHVVIWHLEILLKFNFIKKFKFMNHFLYCDSNSDLELAKASYIASKKSSKKIIEYLINQDESFSKSNISSDLDMHYNTVTKYIALLEEYNIVLSDKKSKIVKYRINKNHKGITHSKK